MTFSISAILDPVRKYWRIPVGVGVLAGGIAILWSRADDLDVWEQAVGWTLIVITFGALMHSALAELLGPVFAFDSIRTARRSRFALLRALYALVLLFVLFVVYTFWFGFDFGTGFEAVLEEHQLPANDQARFANSFFNTFLVVQFCVMMAMVPAFTAGAIAEEREKGTLDVLLTTELTSREIILGKLISRISNLVLLLLAGVPILALLQLMGGVDPALLLAAFVYTLLTMLSMGAACLVFSASAPRLRQAVFTTYFFIVGYQLGVAFLFANYGIYLDAIPGARFLRNTLAAASVGWSYYYFGTEMARGTGGSALVEVLVQYLLFHGTLATLCIVQAARVLTNSFNPKEKKKRAGAKARQERLPQAPRPPKPPKPRPPVNEDSPLLWKECYIEPASRERQGGKEARDIRLVLMAFFWVIIGATGFGVLIANIRSDPATMGQTCAYAVLAPVFCLALLQQVLLAGGTISGERDRQTFDSLLMTELENGEILRAKWLGCLLSFKTLGFLLASFLGVGALATLFSFASLPIVLISILVHMAFAITLGMLCSALSRTSFRATVASLTWLLVVTMGHWLLFLVEATVCRLVGQTDLIGALTTFHTYGLTPPMNLATLATLGSGGPPREAGMRVLCACLGIVFYAGLAGILWFWLRRRFSAITGRRE
jgi:ABC-type transport system involved in multi-copper enzyme maturation permease subunit